MFLGHVLLIVLLFCFTNKKKKDEASMSSSEEDEDESLYEIITSFAELSVSDSQSGGDRRKRFGRVKQQRLSRKKQHSRITFS